MTAPLAGQIALVTGASRGIGRAIARQLAADGARVFVNFVRDTDAAQETVRLIRDAGGEATPLQFDVADAAASAAAIAGVAKDAGGLHVLVNNAGMAIDNLLLRLKPEEWDEVMAVNLRGTFNCTRAAARPMLRQHHGRIINFSSVVGQMGNAGQAAYAAAKAGIIGFSKSMARELASRQVTVNAVAPGLIETEMTAYLPEDRRTEYLAVIPAGRLGTVEEVALLVAFLARREAGYITGQVIGINGGLYL
ncbi:MAG: 3-oxoacyl-[acyl-carrier-protein] reductase [Deltaproteobacteria bacterium]|nr:3-oxoacyl-[acyl-carrier-protein] reductase [Deltaproteobacteria bacterium]